MEDTENFLVKLLKDLVAHPDDISVETYENEEKVMFHVRCNKDDKGRLIGMSGRTSQSIQQMAYTRMQLINDLRVGDKKCKVVRVTIDQN